MVIFQGDTKACVPCAISYAALLTTGLERDWRNLYQVCGKPSNGVEANIALKIAKKWGWIKNYIRIPTFLARWFGRYFVVLLGVPMHRIIWAGTDAKKPIVWDGINDESHMVVYGDSANNGNFSVMSWGNPEKQDVRILDKNYPILIAYICL